MPISFVINSGGKSSRLIDVLGDNTNKSWLKIDNEYIIHSNILNIADFVDEIIVIVKNTAMIEIFENRVHSLNLPLEVRDKIKIKPELTKNNINGPIAGIISSLTYVTHDTIFFAPNDHPYLSIDDYLVMKKYLEKNSLVTIHNLKNNLFDPNLFVINKNTLQKYKDIKFRRITDIYRIIPNIILIEKKLNIESLYGVNSQNDLKNTKKYKSEFSISVDNIYSSKVCHVTNKILKNTTEKLSKEALEAEKLIWENISPLITRHIEQDLQKLDEKSNEY